MSRVGLESVSSRVAESLALGPGLGCESRIRISVRIYFQPTTGLPFFFFGRGGFTANTLMGSPHPKGLMERLEKRHCMAAAWCLCVEKIAKIIFFSPSPATIIQHHGGHRGMSLAISKSFTGGEAYAGMRYR